VPAVDIVKLGVCQERFVPSHNKYLLPVPLIYPTLKYEVLLEPDINIPVPVLNAEALPIFIAGVVPDCNAIPLEDKLVWLIFQPPINPALVVIEPDIFNAVEERVSFGDWILRPLASHLK